ncbi:hypothetical protein CEXT_342241 [Caerostris extrusa]|uniref:Uncharacterized protein n=1 Tax=Caerostris extrusa TaxID=172846 RepID=A0AAV4VAV2_CAEEX|nr:hypothetical protein CEXT_342241 [Caerostris extrusa]
MDAQTWKKKINGLASTPYSNSAALRKLDCTQENLFSQKISKSFDISWLSVRTSKSVAQVCLFQNNKITGYIFFVSILASFLVLSQEEQQTLFVLLRDCSRR